MTSLGPYEIDRKLGEGAFGAVYKAVHRDRPDHPVALKVIDSQGGDVNRLLAEPALLAQVKHPCVVGVEDYFTADGKLAIALEFVNGEDLKAILDRGDTFAPEQVRTLLIQLGGALSAAHAQQIVHRDIKPANILVDRSGGSVRFVLTDFGIGRRHEGLQIEKHAGGTYHFMAPEQLRGRPGPQSDLWALGVVAYRLLTGRLPFPGPSLPELARQIQFATPPPPSEIHGWPLPNDLEAAVMKLLEKSLTERTHSAEQMLIDLGYHGDSTKVTQAPTRTSNAKGLEPLEARLRRTVRRQSWLVVACVLIYILPGGLIAGSLMLSGIALFFASQTADRTRGRRRAVWLTAAALIILAGSRAWSFGGAPDFNVFEFLGGQFAAEESGDVPAPSASKSEAVTPVKSLQVQSRRAPARQTKVSGQNWREPLVWLVPALGVLAFVVVFLILPVVGSAAFAAWRRARREQAVWDLAVQSGAGSDQFLATLRNLVDARIEDVGFHLRYAEALAARGDHRAAAVEARLILVQDPYHFNGNLLLANAFAALGLWSDCRRVCDEYLDVAGYCFEFDELRQQCLARVTP